MSRGQGEDSNPSCLHDVLRVAGRPRRPRCRLMSASTVSIPAAVSLPVNVFCCEGWNERRGGARRRGRGARRGRTRRPSAAARGPGRAGARQRILAHLAQDEHGAQAREEAPLAGQVLAAAADLFRERPVGGRRAAGRGRDVAVDELQAVAARDRGRLAREAGAMQRGEEEVAGAVAGEDASGAVAAVRGREPGPR